MQEFDYMFLTEKGSVPLYVQIKDWLVDRISVGDWGPGSIIPSEMQLAQELQVSQGTIRKAINDLVERNVFTRKQGKGTFVANHDIQRELFHFLNIADDKGEKVVPESQILSCRSKRATQREFRLLQLRAGGNVKQIERIRFFKGEPTILETICLPEPQFKKLGHSAADQLPNLLYELYEKQFGVTIHSARERIRAVSASAHDVKHLGVDRKSPLLEIERIALTLDQAPVEIRISRCNTMKHHYGNTIL